MFIDTSKKIMDIYSAPLSCFGLYKISILLYIMID